MSVYWEKGKGRWRFTFNRKVRNGEERKRIRATKLLPKGWSQRQAEKYDRDESARLYSEATGVTAPRLKLAPAVQFYLEYRCPGLKNGRKAAQDLAHLCDEIEHAYLDEVADVFDRHCKAHPGLAPATLRNRGSYLKASVRYARKRHKYGKGLPDYTEDMDLPVPDNDRQVYAKLPELKRLWRETPDIEARALYTLAFYLGLRWRAELLTRGTEHVQRNRRDVWLEIGKTKNGDPIMKYVHPEARWALDYIPFAHCDSYYYSRWHKAREAIGRPDLKPHDAFRHSLASEIISRPGGTLDDVRAALHHRSLQAAKRYSHRYAEAVKRVLGATGGRIRAHRRKTRSGGKLRKAA